MNETKYFTKMTFIEMNSITVGRGDNITGVEGVDEKFWQSTLTLIGNSEFSLKGKVLEPETSGGISVGGLKTKEEKMEIEQITYDIAASVKSGFSGWLSTAEVSAVVETHRFHQLSTTGYVVNENAEYIIVALLHDGEGRFNEFFRIPKRSIIKREILKVIGAMTIAEPAE